jgi:hypothetical protein
MPFRHFHNSKNAFIQTSDFTKQTQIGFEFGEISICRPVACQLPEPSRLIRSNANNFIESLNADLNVLKGSFSTLDGISAKAIWFFDQGRTIDQYWIKRSIR